MSETEPDSGWSEQYAETGGWPPPGDGQRRYGPGAPAGDRQDAADPGADPADPAPDPAAPTTRSTPEATGHAGPWEMPVRRSGQGDPWEQPAGYGTGPGQADQQGHAGPPSEADQWGRAGTGGYGTGWGQADQPGYPGPSAYAQGDQWGQPSREEQSGPGAAWAPGDPAYGRLGPKNPPQQRQRPRRPWEGRPAPVRRPGGTPVVTYTLVAICVVVYLIQQADPSFTGRYALIPFAVEQGQYARMITSAFLHAGLLHLATNMITLFIVGTPLERVLRPARFLLVYVLSALGGSLLSVWLSPEFSIGVGASGAIFGLFGALVVLRRQVGAEAGGLAVLIGLNLVISFTVPNISWQAHIGGLVTGVLVALALRGVDRLSRRPAS